MKTSSLLLALVTVSGCAASPSTVRTTTEIRADSRGAEVASRTTTVNGIEVEKLRKEWESEYVEATGTAPYVEKYVGETARNQALATMAAKAMAQQALVEKVSAVQVTATTSVADLMASTLTQTRVRGVVQDAEVVSAQWLKGNEQYEVRLRMPKLVLLRIIEESHRP